MAVNEVQLTISVGDNGSLGVVAKKADAAAKSTGRLSRSTKDLGRVSDTTYRTMQGTAGTSSNLTKNFAKQAQGIQGGLVPAYATLAANVFAITAAFGALQRAAQVEQLVEGFTFLGNVAGRTATLVAESLVKITDNALSMEQALRAASAGFSAGFDTTSMQRLAQVARNAATALGRDVGDATDRLIRGVAKLEPEILDELGIFVRLEPAVEKYSLALGKSKDALTEAERRQAFLNEALAQGERKFGNLSGQVPTNPYDQLAAAFNNLAKSFFNLVNNGLTPIINFFANNMTAFTGALVLFGSTVVQQMVPALGQMADVAAQKAERVVGAAERMRDKAAGATRELEQSLRNMNAPVGKNNIYKQILPSIVDGTASSKKLERATKAVKNAITGKTNVMKKAGKDEKKIYQDQIRDLEKVEQKLKDIANARKGGGTAALKADLAESKGISALLASDEAAAVQNADGVLESFALASTGFSDYRERMKDTFKQEKDLVGGRGKAFKKFGLTVFQGFTKAAVGARLFGIAIVGAIPYIGKFLLIGGIVLGFLKKLFSRTTKVTEAQDKLNTVLDTMAEKDAQFKKEVKRLKDISTASTKAANDGEIYANTLKIQAGFTDEFTSSVIGLNNAIMEENAEMGLFGALFHLASSGVIETLRDGFNMLADPVISLGSSIKKFFTEGFAELLKVDEIDAIVKQVQEFVETQRQAKIEAEALIAVTEAYNKALSAEGKLADMVKAKFEPKGGLAGAIKELTDAGHTTTEALGMINDELAKLGQEVNLRNQNVQNLGDSFVELTSVLSKFREKAKAKDEFLEISKQIDDRITLVSRIAESEGLSNAANILADNFEDGKTNLTQFGITLKDLQEEGTPKLVELSDKFKDISELQNTIKERQKQMKLDVEFTKAAEAAANAQTELKNIAETLGQFGVGNLPGLDYYDAVGTAYSAASTSINLEFQRKKQIADMEYDLIDRKLALQEILNQGDEKVLASLAQQRRVVEETRQKVAETLSAQEGAAQDKNATTFVTAQVSQRDALVNSIKNAETLDEKLKIIAQALRDVGDASEDGAFDDLFSIFDPKDQTTKIIDGTKAQIDVVKDLVRSGIEEFNKLGPEGEVVATMLEGMLLITDQFVKLGETIESVFKRVAERTGEELGSDGLAGKLKFAEMAEIGLAATATVAASVSALMNTLAAATRNRIAGVDKEIEAEKKRDGKSKESVARIAQLEKKKEALKRKEFEQKKKAMMAEVIMSTAMAIASALPLLSNPITAILGKVLIGMIASMGAAQLAIISGMSYQGGGSGSAGGGVSSVSVGERRSTVDMARSQGARGEIAYMRGERGTGGPENFTPAFGGYRNRAEGGNAAFMVGEQGPELFVPERAGTIVPNDDIGASTNTNVSFNINAVDAAGVEDLLVAQRGNIIGMIREAANSYGEDFVESVDTSILTPSAGGASRY